MRAEATALLRDGMNAALRNEPAAAEVEPEGRAARRRASYYAAVAAHGTLRSRLERTTVTGLPIGLTA
jgi:RNA polymerase sigma factor for flagellar operon FliA